jgi:hypothetical protein
LNLAKGTLITLFVPTIYIDGLTAPLVSTVYIDALPWANDAVVRDDLADHGGAPATLAQIMGFARRWVKKPWTQNSSQSAKFLLTHPMS